MKLKHIGNACCTYEYEGYEILCDPWLTDGAFEGSWYHYPPLKSKPEDFHHVDAIYLSHLHPDHFDEKTLATFPKHIPIIFLDREPNYLKKKIAALGFTKLVAMKDGEKQDFGPFTVTMLGPFVGNLFHDSVIGNVIDSSIVVERGRFQVLNANDNPPTREEAERLRHEFGAFDIVQLVDSCAGPYPACFTNLSESEKLGEKERILSRHLSLMITCAEILEARFMQPFAGHYQLGGRLVGLNDFLAVYNPDEVAHEIGKSSKVSPLLLYEGDVFDLETVETVRTPERHFQWQMWAKHVEKAAYTYDHLEEIDGAKLTRLFISALNRMEKKQKELNCYPDWECSVNGFHFSFAKGGLGGSPNKIYFEVPKKLLGAILERKIHWNNAEVGCHMEIKRNPNTYDPDIHLLLCSLHV